MYTKLTVPRIRKEREYFTLITSCMNALQSNYHIHCERKIVDYCTCVDPYTSIKRYAGIFTVYWYFYGVSVCSISMPVQVKYLRIDFIPVYRLVLILVGGYKLVLMWVYCRQQKNKKQHLFLWKQ